MVILPPGLRLCNGSIVVLASVYDEFVCRCCSQLLRGSKRRKMWKNLWAARGCTRSVLVFKPSCLMLRRPNQQQTESKLWWTIKTVHHNGGLCSLIMSVVFPLRGDLFFSPFLLQANFSTKHSTYIMSLCMSSSLACWRFCSAL